MHRLSSLVSRGQIFRPIVISIAIFALAGCGSVSGSSNNPAPTPTPVSPTPTPTPGITPTPSPTPTPTGGIANDQTLKTEDVATGLDIPGPCVRSGRPSLLYRTAGTTPRDHKQRTAAQPVLDISSQSAGFEAGLTGMDLDPGFSSNGILYIHFCSNLSDGLHCRIASVQVTGNTGTLGAILFDYKAQAPDHTGGRLKVGPDRLLYLSTGDHDTPATAQDLTSMNGKVLRMNLNGTPAAGNPFPANPFVYALGFRDPQGLAFDSSGQLYGTDHGPTSNDEVNIILAGSNYGWPDVRGRLQ